METAFSYDNLRQQPLCPPKGDEIDDGMMAKASQERGILVHNVDNTTAMFPNLKVTAGREAHSSEDDETRNLIMPRNEGPSFAGISDKGRSERSEDFREKTNITAPARLEVQNSDANGYIVHRNGHVASSEFIEEQNLFPDNVKQGRSDREPAETSYYGHDQIDKNHISGFPGASNEPSTIASATALEGTAVTDNMSRTVTTEHDNLHASHGNVDEDNKPSILQFSTSNEVGFGDRSPAVMDTSTTAPKGSDNDTAVVPFIIRASLETQNNSVQQRYSQENFPNSAYATAGSDAHQQKESHLQTRVKKKEKTLQAWRWRNLKKRAEGADKRRELSESRFNISKADERFMKLVRTLRLRYSTSIEDEDSLEDSFQQLQAARDNYGPLEESYTEFEEQLDRDEYQVTQLEEQLSGAETLMQAHTDNGDLSSSYASSTGDLESEWTDVIGDLHPPLFDDYRSRQADASLAREDYSNLVVEYRELFERRQARLRVGMELQPEDQATLDAFPAEETDLLEKIRQLDADVEQLRLLCIEEGLLPDVPADGAASDTADILRDMDSPIITEYDRFPILLQQPENQHDEDVSRALITDFDPNNVGDRITKWLLHKLRSSSVEVEFLARHSRPSTPAAEDSNLNVPFQPTDKWQEEVLDFWFFDDTKLPPSAYAVEATADSADLPRSPDIWSCYPPSFADKDSQYRPNSNSIHRVQLTVRQSSLEGKSEFDLWLHLVPPKRKCALSI
jgi:hypothetical protein